METAFDFTPHHPHPNENDDFVDLRDARRLLARFSSNCPPRILPPPLGPCVPFQQPHKRVQWKHHCGLRDYAGLAA